MKNNVPKDTTKLAGRQYDVSDYEKKDQLSSGLAVTHEQVSDAYMEGEIHPVIENAAGEGVGIPQEGFDKNK